MTKQLVLISVLFFSLQADGMADSLILKTGEVLRGKIVDRNDKSYYFELESGGEKVEVPVSKVSIADITSKTGQMSSKGSLIVFAKAGEDMTPVAAKSEQTYRPVAETSSPSLMPTGLKSKLDIIAKAQKTVADANARTAEAQKQMEALKGIADAANS